jgi:hypothetical protein
VEDVAAAIWCGAAVADLSSGAQHRCCTRRSTEVAAALVASKLRLLPADMTERFLRKHQCRINEQGVGGRRTNEVELRTDDKIRGKRCCT